MENVFKFWKAALNTIKKEIASHVKVDTFCSRKNVFPDNNVNLFRNWLAYVLVLPENVNLLR